MEQEITVAYVEDEPSIAQLLSSGLGLFGIEVYPVYMSAEELLANVDNKEFATADILLFDIRLPKMTGLELAAKLREQGEDRPLVLVSAWPKPSDEELDAIDAAFLPKPFDFSDVVQTIRELVWE
ncbi:MAG: response regulator [Candidatus Promineifilaceae bacterium]|nr:response regulator [Candidatus Promineifilaceae bacterium]